jgi:N-acetylglucosamine kinase-like BadF-type ATPase
LVQAALKSVFRHAETEVYSDMMGAARALLQHSEGVACILGTGSNSCLYDGEKFIKNVPALGFILGDEGSGAVLGKRLVADLLKNQLTNDLKEQFLKEYNLTQADIIERVYRQPFPNRFLASLSRFCADHLDNPMIHELVYEHFQTFVTRILKQYPSVPVGFVGSIAYYYREVLERVMMNNHVQLAQIVQSPMDGLIAYHQPDVRPTMV